MRKLAVIFAVLAAALVFVPELFAAEAVAPCGMRYIIQGAPSAAKARPLAVLLHGAGGAPGGFINAGPFGAEYIRVAPYAATPGVYEDVDVPKIADMIKDLKKRFKISHVICFGFSQGAFIGVRVAMQYPELVTGAISCSGGLGVIPPPDNEDVKRVAFAFIHGSADGTVPVDRSRQADRECKKAGYKYVFYEEVPGYGHNMHKGSIDKAYAWMLNVIKQGGGGGDSPWTKAEITERANAAIAFAKQKKYDEAFKELGKLREKKCRVVDENGGKNLAELLQPLADGTEKELKLFALKAMGYASAPGIAALKKIVTNSDTPEDEFLAACEGLGLAGEDAVPVLVPILKSEQFGYKAAKAAAEALGKTKALKSFKHLLDLLEDVEKKEAEMGILKDPVNKALSEITGANYTTAEQWKEWAKKKK